MVYVDDSDLFFYNIPITLLFSYVRFEDIKIWINIYRMPPLIIGRNNITIGGKKIETSRYIGLIKQVAIPLLNTVIQEPVFNDTSLIAHYKFDGNYNDSSGNNHHLTNNGSILRSIHAINGQLVEFDNTDYLEFPSTINPYTIWNGGTGITFAFWVKISSSSGNGSRLIDFQTSINNTGGILIAENGATNTGITIWVNGSQGALINLHFTNNEWRHISFSVSTTGVWSVYINGFNQNVSMTRNIPNITYNFRYINKSVYAADGTWDGQMDDFRIYNKVLTQNEIRSLYFSKNTLVPITINADYKYMSFVNTEPSLIVLPPPQTYTINFPEQTEVQLLLLDNLKYIETTPFLTSGSNNIVVGVPSTFSTITTTTNSTAYNSGYVSTITGTSVAYNNPIVIIRYKTTKVIVPININDDYNYFSLTYTDIPEVVYDFTPYNTLQSWISYANSFGATTNVTSFDPFEGVSIGGSTVGHITYPLPNNYNYIDVTFRNTQYSGNVNLYIDNVLKITATGAQTRKYSDTYTTGQILKIDETNTAAIAKNILIKLSRRQSQYSINFSENTECDILVVGGGGGGGSDNSGGGGAGGLVFIQNYIANGSYTVNVGNGGLGAFANQANKGISGNSSSFNKLTGGVDGTTDFTAMGGGGGGTGDGNLQNGMDGGSGGGSAYEFTQGTAGNTNQQTYTGYDGIKRGFGNDGGIGYNASTGQGAGGGGGGAGEKGFNSGTSTGTTNRWGGRGGNGLSEVNGIDFKTHFNLQINNTLGEYISSENKTYFAGGGGGGNDDNTVSIGTPLNNIGGKGGGADGSVDDNDLPRFNALINTGGGGGGRTVFYIGSIPTVGGNGSSGIVLIRYKKIEAPFDAQWTYNPSNLNVYHLGNVGIGTINPTSALDVLGSVVVNGGISTNSYIASIKTFKIEHPLNINKWLYHGCIEAPRFDNIYRGKKMLINGTCEVDIDSECNTTGGMTTGTFMALNNNFSLHLQNKSSFDGVKGEIIDGKIIISCENIADEIEVEWLVIGERHDEGIIRNNLTNNEGMLICEHEY